MRFTVDAQHENENQRRTHRRNRRRDVLHHRVRPGLRHIELGLLYHEGRQEAQGEAAVQVPEQWQARRAEAQAHPRRASAEGQEANCEREEAVGARDGVRPPRGGGSRQSGKRRFRLAAVQAVPYAASGSRRGTAG